MKKISAGLIITDGDKFLICKTTLAKTYDLPKGMVENNENHKEACIRECKEETGLDFSYSEIIDLGIYEYMSYKDLHLFMVKVNILPSIDTMNCASTFTRYGKDFPEVNGYKYISFNEIDEYMNKSMIKTLKQYLKGNIVC